MSEKSKKTKKTKKKSHGAASFPMMFIGSIGLAILLKLSFIFFLAGILPSVVAGIVDVSPKRQKFKTVMAFNISGIVPYLAGLWKQGNSAEAVYTLVSQPGTWLIVYGAAAAGWGMVWLAPRAGMLLMEVFARGQIARFQHLQKRLVEEWGPEIKRDAEHR